MTGTVARHAPEPVAGMDRNPHWTDITGQPAVPGLRRPAFTGHENLQEVSLVHMNGRVYDPNVSHMVSADPFVQFPGNGQSFNRNAYVLNNPLSHTDPTGFCISASACPSGGLAGSRVLPGRATTPTSVTVTAHTRIAWNSVLTNFASAALAAFGSIQNSGGIGGVCINAGCSPYPGAIQFDADDQLPTRSSRFRLWGSIGETFQTYYVVSTVAGLPGMLWDFGGDGSGGGAAAHTQGAYEQNWVGQSVSPQGGVPNGFMGQGALSAMPAESAYLVGRSLAGIGGIWAGHMYIVTDAAYVGDPEVSIYSYGSKEVTVTVPWCRMTGPNCSVVQGLAGPVDRTTKGLSADTHEDDREHWRSLANLDNRDAFTVAIPAANADVRSWAARVVPTHLYRLPGVNSNSIAQGIANRASGVEVRTPRGMYPGYLRYGFPGSEDWQQVVFK